MANVEKGVILIPRFTRNYQKKKERDTEREASGKRNHQKE
jgi:hypothetical protein